jgi:hypothetical protein
MLALGAMPVLTGMIAVLQCSALCALEEMPAKGLSPALFNSLHGGEVAGEQAVYEFGAIRRAIAPEDVGQLKHSRPPAGIRDLPGGD